jgi:hypothetical protein
MYKEILLAFLLIVGVQSAFSQKQDAMYTAGWQFGDINLGDELGSHSFDGFHVRMNLLEFGNTRAFIPKPQDSTTSIAVNHLSFGARISFGENVALGRRKYDIWGALLKPYAYIGFSRFKFDEVMPNAQKSTTWGLEIAPVVSLQLPYVVGELRLNTILNFSSKGGLPTFMFAPTINIDADALFHVFDPQISFNGVRRGMSIKDSTAYNKEYDMGTGKYYYDTEYYRVYTPYEYEQYVYNTGPYQSLGIRYTYENKSYVGATKMWGLAYTARAGSFGIDAIFDRGRMGFASSMELPSTTTDLHVKDNNINKDDSRFIGTVQADVVKARVLVDVIDAISSMGRSDDPLGATKFIRIMGGVGLGYAWFSDAKFQDPLAVQELDQMFAADTGLYRNHRTDQRLMRSSIVTNLVLGFEMGNLSVMWERNLFRNASLASTPAITFMYSVPLRRIIDKYRVIHLLNKNEE